MSVTKTPYLCIANLQKERRMNLKRIRKGKNMKQKSLILMSTLLVCSLESFAQSDVEKTIDMASTWQALPWLPRNRW